MFRSKSDVDKHVKDLLRKVKNEHERNLRCYHIASMYYKAQDFESAKKYVCMYLSVRDDSSLAHKLLGQCYEGLNLKDKALVSYRRSLELEANQAELILKICELLCDKDVEFDPTMARYWADRASSLFPHDPSVFMLKEKLLFADDSDASNDLENLLHSELKARPTDVAVRIKLLNLYVDSGRTELALNHAFEVESRQAHCINLTWYQCISHICEVYQKECPAKCGWDFYIQWLSALDRVCSLSLSEIPHGSDLIESTETIYNLDQIVFRANTSIQSPPEIYKEFIKHVGAQLMFHITLLLLKRAKKQGNGLLWKETKRMIVPLLLMANVDSPDVNSLRSTNVKETHQKMLKIWINLSRCRSVQAGQMLHSLVKEVQSEKLFLEKVFHFTVNNWKLQIFQKVFSSIDDLNHSSSYFLASNSNIPQKIPSLNNFKPSMFVSNFENIYVGSLHHLVWLGIQSLHNSSTIVKCKIAPSFHTTYFKNLQFTVTRLNNVGVESLNQLDIDSFLYATVFCAGMALDDQKVNGYFPPDKPLILPADISTPLCTTEQSKWWIGACSITKSGADSLTHSKNSMSELRHLLQRGLEIVRGENIPLPLLINIARTFTLRAAESEKIDEAEGCEARALHLWQLAVPQLERLTTGRSLNKYQKNNLFFDYPMKEMETYEVNGLLEEARYSIGCHLMKTEKYEEAIENFKNLNTAQAAFNQALIYQKLAEQQINGYRGEEVTSEMRCNQAVMASKARDSLFRARDMIKDNHSHPFYYKIKDKLIEVDELLSRIEPENANNLFHLGLGEKDICNTDGNLSCESGGSPGLVATNSRVNHSQRYHPTSTPKRHYDNSKHRSNSAEVVEILTMQQNTSQLKMQQLLEHLKLTLEKLESVIFEQRSQRSLIEDLTSKFSNFETETKQTLSELKKEVKRPDLYNMIEEEEYPDEMLQYQNYTSYYPPQRSVQGSGAVAYGGTAMPQYFSPRVDQVYQGNVGFYNQGALPFSDGQQLPDFLRTMQPKLPPSLTPQGIASLQSSLGLSASSTAGAAPSIGNLNTVNRVSSTNFHGPSSLPGETNRIPTNVVITTSDTLPKGVPPVQPTLSVTIPPQHRLGDVNSSIGATINTPTVPHQFQIQLPQQPQQQQQRQQQILHQPLQQPQFHQIRNVQKSTSAEESDDEYSASESINQGYDSHISTSDFKSFAHLSKEVSAVTDGEQDEVIFIAKQAKLYKYVNKSWKEKGMGDIKILKDKTTNKARILMTKDKSQKIYANHLLTPDMELVPILAMGAAWSWTALDFADELIHPEKLCAKFKSVEDSQKFKEVFDKVKFPELAASTGKEETNIGVSSNAAFPVKSVPSSIVSSAACSLFTTSQSTSLKGGNIPTTTPMKINAGGFTFLAPPKLTLPEETNVVKPVEAKKTESPFANLNFAGSQTTTDKADISSGGLLKEPLTKIDSNKSFFNTSSPFPNMDNASCNRGDTSSSPFAIAKNTGLFGTKPLSDSPLFSYQASTKLFGDSSILNKSVEDQKQTQQSPFQGAGTKVFGSDNKPQLSTLSSSPSATTEAEASSQNTEDDFVPTATFEPVVPLPELVKLVSGEEGETVLFEERAKLYRYCKETKQWKERGTGKMKILKNEQTGVVRLVMRREQVLKVCCNHRLTKDIVLSRSTTSDRSYSWAAKDFSDENSEGVNEIFTLKLKNTEQALAFKEAFEKAQANSVEGSPSITKMQPNKELPPLKANYEEGTWECQECYVPNNKQTIKCVSCCSSKPGVSPVANQESIAASTPFKFTFGIPFTSSTTSTTNTSQTKPLSSLITCPPGGWTCSDCYIQNKADDSTCIACESSKPGNKPSSPLGFGNSYITSKFDTSGFFSSKGSFSSGESQTSSLSQKSEGFVFGIPNNKDTSIGDTSKGPKPVFNFGVTPSSQEGQIAKSTFTFSLNKTASAISASSIQKHDSGSEQGDSDNEATANDSDIYFQPVIPLPEKINVVTGEEDETILYCHRAKLYRYDINTKEWKERGVGDIKILKHNISGKIRLLLRREPVFKLSLNHFLTPDIVMKKKDDKSWLWCAKDFASGEVVQEQFAIRFKTPDIAKEFKEAIDNTQLSQVTTTVGNDKEEKCAETTDSEGFEILYERKVSEDLRKKAELYQLPPNFYSYLDAKPCPGCPGCDLSEDEEKQSTTQNKAITTTKKETTKVVLRQPKLITGNQTKLPQQITKTESSSPANPTREVFFGNAALTGKETTTGSGFFTQTSFTSSSPTVSVFGGAPSEPVNRQISYFGDSTVSEPNASPKTSIFGGSSAVAEPKTSPQPSIFGGGAAVGDVKPAQTTMFGIGTSAVPDSNQKFFFGDGGAHAQPTIFGGTPSGGLLNKPKESLFFGGGGEGDLPKLNQFAAETTAEESSKETVGKVQENNFKGDKVYVEPTNPNIPRQTNQQSTTGGGAGDLPNYLGTTKIEETSKETPGKVQEPKFTATKETENQFSQKPMFGIKNLPSLNSISDASNTFGSTPDNEMISFSSLSSSVNPNQTVLMTSANPNVKWQGAGSQVFGGRKVTTSSESTHNTSGRSDDGACEESEHDPHFEPIIAMPDLIDLKTGEEDEIVVFKERAKLYRYDPVIKEWKERGVGQMKILKHKDANVYRLLMRREVVHKIVCNQRITADLDLKPMARSQNAFCWFSMNLAQDYDEPMKEQLSIKFKNEDLAMTFKKYIDEAIKNI